MRTGKETRRARARYRGGGGAPSGVLVCKIVQGMIRDRFMIVYIVVVAVHRFAHCNGATPPDANGKIHPGAMVVVTVLGGSHERYAAQSA